MSSSFKQKHQTVSCNLDTASLIVHDEKNDSKLFLTSERGMENMVNNDKFANNPIFVLTVMDHPPSITFPKNVVGMKFVKLQDTHDGDLYSILKSCTQWIENGMQTKNAIVIVHCAHGISRSASVVIAYLMEYYNLAFADAFAYVKRIRRIIDPNDGFVSDLIKFEKDVIHHGDE